MNIHTRAYLIENKSAITIFDRFTNPPPPRPCTARPAINIAILTATALNALPIKKTAIAIAPDIAYFAPDRRRGPVGENVGGAHPDVACVCVEVLGYGGEGGGDDGYV